MIGKLPSLNIGYVKSADFTAIDFNNMVRNLDNFQKKYDQLHSKKNIIKFVFTIKISR